MKIGDLVKADSFLDKIGDKIGIVTFVQDAEYCRSARVLFDTEMVFMAVDNLRVINESRR